MKIVDLSHVFEEGMSVFPGAPEPVFEQIGSVKDGDVYQLTKFEMTTHTGTHMDCTTHVSEEGYYTDTQDLSFFIGKGLVIDCSDYVDDEEMGMEIFDGYQLDDVNFIFLYCDWAKKWGTPEFWSGYPYISEEVTRFIANHESIRGIGLEYGSLDPDTNPGLDLHKILLKEEKTIMENLNNLDKLIGKDFTYIGLPLKIKDGDGSPIRPVGIIKE